MIGKHLCVSPLLSFFIQISYKKDQNYRQHCFSCSLCFSQYGEHAGAGLMSSTGRQVRVKAHSYWAVSVSSSKRIDIFDSYVCVESQWDIFLLSFGFCFYCKEIEMGCRQLTSTQGRNKDVHSAFFTLCLINKPQRHKTFCLFSIFKVQACFEFSVLLLWDLRVCFPFMTFSYCLHLLQLQLSGNSQHPLLCCVLALLLGGVV